MNRVGPSRSRRERMAGMVPLEDPARLRRRSCEVRGDVERAAALARRARADVARCSSRHGTATGIAAPTSTTAPRSAPPRPRNAGSTRSRRAGPCCPAPRRAAPSRARHGRAFACSWCGATPASSSCSHPRSTRRRSIPVHQGLRAGRARERRPVHPRGAVDGDGDRAPGQRRRGGRAVPHAESDQPHAARPADVERYKVEPYVVAADVYTHPAHIGRGGWTWYTGSAAWMYRLGLESILGLQAPGPLLRHCTMHSRLMGPLRRAVAPWAEHCTRSPSRIPDAGTAASRRRGWTALRVDSRAIPLVDDGAVHRVRVVMGEPHARCASGYRHRKRRFIGDSARKLSAADTALRGCCSALLGAQERLPDHRLDGGHGGLPARRASVAPPASPGRPRRAPRQHRSLSGRRASPPPRSLSSSLTRWIRPCASWISSAPPYRHGAQVHIPQQLALETLRQHWGRWA